MSYVVRRRPPALALLQPLGAVGFLSIWILRDAPWPMTAILGVAVVVVTAVQIRASGTLLRVDARGISLSTRKRDGSPVHIPWASVRAVVVVMGPNSAPQVGVRLHHVTVLCAVIRLGGFIADGKLIVPPGGGGLRLPFVGWFGQSAQKTFTAAVPTTRP